MGQVPSSCSLVKNASVFLYGLYKSIFVTVEERDNHSVYIELLSKTLNSTQDLQRCSKYAFV